MTLHLVSWFHADSERFKSTYSQTLGDSASRSHYALYERCLRVLFASARRWNPDARLVLVTNEPVDAIFGRETAELLERAGVASFVTPNTHETPAGYWGRWQNQFYVLDVARTLLEDPAVADDDAVLVLDSDCVVTAPLSERLLGDEGLAALVIGMSPDVAENGVTRRELTELVGAFPDSVPRPAGAEPVQYLGGELLAARAAVLRTILARAEAGFRWSLERRAEGLPALNEEAHLLSFAVQSLGLRWRDATFIARLWTQPWKFRTVTPPDAKRLVWHLPAEKKTGIARLDAARRAGGWFADAPAPAWRRRAGTALGVPRYPWSKYVLDLGALVALRIRRRIGQA